MENRLFIIFTDFDGVEARVQTWGNDTKFASACLKIGCPEMRDLDIYAFNSLDRLCRLLGENDKVWLVSTSIWKRVFDTAKNRHFISKWAGLKKIEIVHKNRKSFDRFSPSEPFTRVKLINWYLSKYHPDGYVVFDDNYEATLRSQYHKHFIRTDRADGLTYDHLYRFRSILGTWMSPDVSKQRENAFQTLLAGI